MDVIGVGDADIDIYLDVDHIPARDEKIVATRVDLHPGGMVANFLVALCRLGISCGFHGPVGADEFGRLTLDDLSENGVDISGAVIKEGERTYFCTVMLDGSGEKSLVVAPTGCVFPKPDDVSEDHIARASRHLHTTAAVLSTAEKALYVAKKHALTTSLDLEPSVAKHKDALISMLHQVDLLFINQRAAAVLSETEDPAEAARSILVHGPSVVCVTMGGDGVFVADEANQFKVDAFPVTVVDSTGAGDCFAAGFVYGFLQRWPLKQVSTFASAVGALSVTQRGGHTGAPTSKAVDEFLAAHQVQFEYPI